MPCNTYNVRRKLFCHDAYEAVNEDDGDFVVVVKYTQLALIYDNTLSFTDNMDGT